MDAISSSTASRYQAYDPAADDSPAQASSLDMCRKADNLVTAYICDEPVTMANVCKSTSNDVEKFVCDDKKMAGLQQGIWEATKSVLGALFSGIVGQAGKK